MTIIYNKVQIANQITSAISKIAKHRDTTVIKIDLDLASKLKGRRGAELSVRTLRAWKEPSNIPNEIDDRNFFGLLWYFLSHECIHLDWLENLLTEDSTSVPFYIPISPDLLRAYLQQAWLSDKQATPVQINQIIQRLLPHPNTDVKDLVLEHLVPLDSSTIRPNIKNSSHIRLSGISLFRFIRSYDYEFERALNRGVKMQVLLSNPNGHAMAMAELRSTSGVSVHQQKQDIVNALAKLDHIVRNIQDSKLEIRFLDYLPPYGLAIYTHKSDPNKSVCKVRLYTFRTPTSYSPVLLPTRKLHFEWFEFFQDQFDKMWAAATPRK